VPEDIISAEEFDLMHVYVIPKKQLRGRTISLYVWIFCRN